MVTTPVTTIDGLPLIVDQEVLKPLPVDAGKAAPAFNQPGGGIQYQVPNRATVSDLVTGSYLKCIKGPGC